MPLTWLAVDNSSHVTAIARNEENNDVAIRFHDGAEYTYHNVSAEDWDRLLESGSKGRFVNIALRRKYAFTRTK
jgi:predicted transcriptional regulator